MSFTFSPLRFKGSTFFKEQILENNIFKIDSLVIEEEHKIIINDKTNIYLEKLLLPILKQARSL